MLIYSQPYHRKTPRLAIQLARAESEYVLEVERLADAPEVLYRLAAVVFAYDFSIVSADIRTDAAGNVRDVFRIQPLDALRSIDDLIFEAMMNDFERVLFEAESVLDYLEEKGRELERPRRTRTSAEFENGQNGEVTVLVRTEDRAGALLSMTQVFALMSINIMSAKIGSDAQVVQNEFRMNPGDRRLRDERFRSHLRDALRVLV